MFADRWKQVMTLVFVVNLFMTAGTSAQETATVKDDGQGAVVKILSRDSSGGSTFVRGPLGTVDLTTKKATATVDFLHEFVAEYLEPSGREGFFVQRESRDHFGQIHVRHRQTIDGLPVIGAQLIVHIKEYSGEVVAVNGRFVAARDLPGGAVLKAGEAFSKAWWKLGVENVVEAEKIDEPELVYVMNRGRAHIAWRQRVRYVANDRLHSEDVFADALTGALVVRHPRIYHAKSWQTYSAGGAITLPGDLVCENEIPCVAGVARDTHAFVSEAYDFYKNELGRLSYDDEDSTVVTTVSFGWVNSFFWDTDRKQMVFGDGDGVKYSPTGRALDTVVHEFTHGVTQDESDLVYRDESGALNEAWSDIFAAGAESKAENATHETIWRFAEDVFTPNDNTDALRYMNDPTADSIHDHLNGCEDGYSRDYYPKRFTDSCDNGGVHFNSGIANLAFYLLVEGGTHPQGETTNYVPGIGMDQALAIFYQAQVAYLTESSTFEDARWATVQAAADVGNAANITAVHEAWCAVGVPGCPGAPVARDDYLQTDQDTRLWISFTSDLAPNDTGVGLDLHDWDLHTAQGGSNDPPNSPDGFYYYPPAGFSGDTDHFTYTVIDDIGQTASATVFVEVMAINQPPTANDDFLSVPCGVTSFEIDAILDNDTNPSGGDLDACPVDLPQHGTIDFHPGLMHYHPGPAFWVYGKDLFTYRASEDSSPLCPGTSNEATAILMADCFSIGRTIFEDSFESDDLSAWLGPWIPAGGSLSVTSAAAMSGNRGLEVVTDSATVLMLSQNTTVIENHYNAAFLLDRHNLEMADGDSIALFAGLETWNGPYTVQLRLRRLGNDYKLKLDTWDDASSWAATPWFTLLTGVHAVRLEWWAADKPGNDDGGIRLWVDGEQVGELLGLDNDEKGIGRIRFGALGVDPLTTGTFYLDAFRSWRGARTVR